jgi:hypothetical protein
MTAVRGVRRVIDALTWFIIGMVFMSRMYCINLGITSGVNYIGWDTVVFTVGGLLMVQILLWIDPSFKTKEELDKAMGRKHIRMTTKSKND